MFVSVDCRVTVVSYHVTGSEVRYRRLGWREKGSCEGKYGALSCAFVWRNFSEGEKC